MSGKRWCWNWQTGMVEGHVPKGVEVQVLSSAPQTEENPRETGDLVLVQALFTTKGTKDY